MPVFTRRSLSLLLCAAAAAAPAFADTAHELPACPVFDAPAAAWGRTEERGFAFALPPGAHAEARGPALDHEFGRWTFDDGGQVYFQYGFAVTELADWLDEKFVTGCRASLDGVDAVFLERRDPNGMFVWAVGLFDYVHSYTPNGDALGEDNPTLSNDLVLIGAGATDAVFAQGRAVFGSFRWARIPESSLAAWSVRDAANNGVLTFETLRGATGMMVATYRDGSPHWLVGSTPGPVMSYRLQDVAFEDGEAEVVAIPLALYETSNGVTPGQPNHPATITHYADAEFLVSLSHDCQRAQLRYRPRDSTAAPTVLALSTTYPLLHGCSAYGR